MIEEVVFIKKLNLVREEISLACKKAKRNESEVTLLPVTKNWPVSAVSYCKNAGLLRVGENRVQEALSKQDEIAGVEWELIGHLQSNKVNKVVGRFCRVQTVESKKLIGKLDQCAQELQQKCSILIQVNAGEDPAKYGCDFQDLPYLLEDALSRPGLVVEGLMTIAPYMPENLNVARSSFFKLREARDELSEKFNTDLKELSMGMTMDLTEAIEAGSTMVRVGSALFGNRT